MAAVRTTTGGIMPLTENQIKKRRDIIADKKHSL